ncbi:MAG: DUF6285 domain-containing protein [Sphingobium sp.]
MRTIPTAPEILRAVSHYLRETLAPGLPPADRFGVLVAANAVDIAAREAMTGAAADEASLGRIRALLGVEAGTLDQLDACLAEAIGTGALPLDHAGLRDHLIATTLDELAIDQPGYASIARMTGDSERAPAA